MIRKHKKTLIFASLLTLAPMLVGLLLRDRLPEIMATHWGIDGQADGWSSTTTAIFVMPLVMLAAQWLLIALSTLDKSNRDKNEKVQKLVFWIIPIISNFCCGLMYALALGMEFSVTGIMMVPMGLMFLLIGNYLPKTRMNATIGIKISWAYSSEENWNATHRFAGRLWVIGGIAMVFLAFVPAELAIWLFLAATLVMVILPCVYSYRFYRMQNAQGVELKAAPAGYQKGSKISKVVVPLILAAVAVLMFTGDINVSYREDAFTVTATYHNDLTVRYDAIDAVEYREGNVPGLRILGFASARLLLGAFENDEFGSYTRYTYTNPDACVVVRSGDNVLVLSGKTAEETQAIYENLLVLANNS